MKGTTTDDPYWTPQFFEYHQVYETSVLCFGVTGLVTNILNFVVFSSKEMKSGRSYLLKTLALSDMIFSADRTIWGIAYYSTQTVYDFISVFSLLWINGLKLVATITFLLSELITLFVGIWRFIAVTWPLKAKIWCDVKRSKIIVVLLAAFSILICLPNLACYRLVNKTFDGHNVTAFAIRPLKGLSAVMLFRVWMPIICIFYLMAMLFLMVITCVLIHNMRMAMKVRRQLSETVMTPCVQTDKITIMLIMIMACCIITHLPMIILYISLFISFNALSKANLFCKFLLGIDKTTTFFIYMMMSRKYRTIIKRIFSLPFFVLKSQFSKNDLSISS